MTCKDKVSLVTGAAGKGMGRSIALTLAREGAKIVVNYRKSEEMAKGVVDHIVSKDGEAIAVQADVFTAAKVVIFYAHDGYSTSLPLRYIIDNDIIICRTGNPEDILVYFAG